jgi:hypothetical protein
MKYLLSFIKVCTNELVQYDRNQLHEFYLDYFNNFLTIDRFAEYHNFTRYEASKILDMGKLVDDDIYQENLKDIYEKTVNNDY